jgi:hypothetical protein
MLMYVSEELALRSPLSSNFRITASRNGQARNVPAKQVQRL